MTDSLLASLGAVRREVSNWATVAPLTWAVVPSRCPPRRGIPALAERPLDVVLRDGVRVRCRINEVFNVLEVFCFGAYDSPRTDWSQVTSILDVGANIGAASLWFARRAPRATIVAVEPAAETAARLRENVARNGLADRIHVVQSALGGRRGAAWLRAGYSSALASVVDSADAGEPVQMQTLADALALCSTHKVDLLQ